MKPINIYVIFQVIFNRLYASSSSTDGGTLLQLRNLINRRNVSQNTDGKFNESIDFFELGVMWLLLECISLAWGIKRICQLKMPFQLISQSVQLKNSGPT